jgi:hypothetical protein
VENGRAMRTLFAEALRSAEAAVRVTDSRRAIIEDGIAAGCGQPVASSYRRPAMAVNGNEGAWYSIEVIHDSRHYVSCSPRLH